jgi:Ni/Co efflux regulator RcnB
MHPIVELYKLLAMSGVSEDVIAKALDLAEKYAAGRTQPDRMAEKRRAWDRKRKRRSTGIPPAPPVPPDPPDLGQFPPETESWHDSCTLSFLSSTSEESKKESKKERSSCGSRIPPDWKPTDRHYRDGSKLGYQREQVDGFAETMRLWAEANAHRPVARKLDWDKTFSGWMRRQPKIPPPPSVPPVTTAEDADRKGGWRPGLPTDAELRQIWGAGGNGTGKVPSRWVRGTDGGDDGEI